MSRPHLTDRELELVRDVIRRHPQVEAVILFGSRAKGRHSPQSDVDLAITGDVPPRSFPGRNDHFFTFTDLLATASQEHLPQRGWRAAIDLLNRSCSIWVCP